MTPLLIIAGIPVWPNADGSFSWLGAAAIDGDGTGPSHGDPDYQNTTSYKPDLNADIDKYIVVPPAIIDHVIGVVMGCKGRITNLATGATTDIVVGDVGPALKLGEISIASASAIGIPSSPTTGGTDDHLVAYQIWPGVAAPGYQLQPAAS